MDNHQLILYVEHVSAFLHKSLFPALPTIKPQSERTIIEKCSRLSTRNYLTGQSYLYWLLSKKNYFQIKLAYILQIERQKFPRLDHTFASHIILKPRLKSLKSASLELFCESPYRLSARLTENTCAM